jgi:oligopeptide/dipeptide ABC transporter ATP-binding protein
MVFQGAMNSLNPVVSIRDQFEDIFTTHRPEMGRGQRRKRCGDLLERVGVARARLSSYPHELSGGMRQRVMIAMAIACNPKLLIADEPTTALDVSVQAEVLELLERLRAEHDMAMLIITHDMGVIAQVAHDVVVMYAGQVIEQAGVEELFDHPEHPYTEALLGALPQMGGADVRHAPLTAIPGQPPDLIAPPEGCRFAPRCPHAGRDDVCAARPQELRELRPGHWVRTAHPVGEREAVLS